MLFNKQGRERLWTTEMQKHLMPLLAHLDATPPQAAQTWRVEGEEQYASYAARAETCIATIR
jgi:hypothetical protein